jgi:membrane-associated phospholipid phosphatase
VATLRITRWFLTGIWLVTAVAGTAQTQGDQSAPSGTQTPDPTPAKIRILPPPPGSAQAAQQDSLDAARLDSAKLDSAKLDLAEEANGWLPPGADPQNTLGWSFVKHLASDQAAFWKSGKDLGRGNLKTFAPFVGFTGLLIASDSWLSKQVPDKPNQLKRSTDVSQYAVYSLIGAAGGSFLWGHLTKNDHLRETGLLATETILNSTALTYAFKGITQRERPFQGDGSGKFFQGGSSFPSEHSAIAWSVATVMAHEYPGPLTKFFAYGLASAVTLTRVTSKEHFPSDVLIGSALGWYLGRQVYRAHHDPEVGGGPWGPLLESDGEKTRNPENMGSPYVPLDSWVYPALERLAALGYVQTAYLGIRPWTRMECARLLEEAGERLRYDGNDGEADRLYAAVASEFTAETARLDGAANLGMSLDSVYTRVTGISGQPLRDGYHFGQTLINDYGRPYGEGVNGIAGFTSHAVAGPLSISVQGEYQHAPAVASDPLSVLQATAAVDGGVPPLPNGTPTINRFRLLDSSIGLTFKNIRVSFGKESLWSAPGESGPFLLSNNASPMTMLQIDNVSPFRIPLVSRFLGPVRTNFFIGQLSGQTWDFNDPTLIGPGFSPQPFVHGNKFSFKPTPNLEFGFGVTAIFGGPGLPFTWNEFLKSYYSHKASTRTNPAKRFSSFDFNYRVPGLRKLLTLYADTAVGDEVSPLGSSRPALNPGIYLPQLPKLPKLEIRAEGFKDGGQGVMYIDRRYRSGYTNDGFLLGSWIGRQGHGGQAWAKYSFSPRTNLQFGYRLQETDRILAGGGRLNDFSLRGEFMLGPEVALSTFLQYEQWNFPVLAPSSKSNITSSVQLTFHPNWGTRK